jgi:hypothetical protein
MKNDLGDENEITTFIYKEPQYRTSVNRTITSIDGGYVLNNIDNRSSVCNIKGKFIANTAKDNNNYTANLDKFTSKIEVK